MADLPAAAADTGRADLAVVRMAVVTPNPAVDVTYRVAATTAGRTHRVSDLRRLAGGKGVNVARVGRRLGANTVSVLPLGGSAGEWIADQLRAEGDPPLVCRVVGETRSTITIVDGAGRATVYAEPGLPLSTAEWRRLNDLVEAATAAADVLVISGSLPTDADPECLARWVAMARDHRVPSIVDTVGAGLLAAAHAGATVLKQNEAELQATMAGHGVGSRMRRLAGRGASFVVVTCGKRGIAATDGTAFWRRRGVSGVGGNPTGAGDAATAAFAVAFARGAAIEDCLRWANAAGAAAVLAPVAGELDLSNFHSFLNIDPS